MNRHWRGVSTLQCSACNRLFHDVDMLSDHQRIMHPSCPEWNGKYPCDSCGLEFPDPSALQCHIRSNYVEALSRLMCPACAHVFSDVYLFQRHIHAGSHKTQLFLVCPGCIRVFSDIRLLQRHIHTKHIKPPPMTRTRSCPILSKMTM